MWRRRTWLPARSRPFCRRSHNRASLCRSPSRHIWTTLLEQARTSSPMRSNHQYKRKTFPRVKAFIIFLFFFIHLKSVCSLFSLLLRRKIDVSMSTEDYRAELLPLSKQDANKVSPFFLICFDGVSALILICVCKRTMARSASIAVRRTRSGPPSRTAPTSVSTARARTAVWACTSPLCDR